MKMLSFLAGELSNANVKQENCNDSKKRIGNDWVPFDYEKRLKDYRLVQTKNWLKRKQRKLRKGQI